MIQLVPGLWHQIIAGGCSTAQAKAYREGATCKLKDLVAFQMLSGLTCVHWKELDFWIGKLRHKVHQEEEIGRSGKEPLQELGSASTMDRLRPPVV